jgi:two-component system chemotaxis sensor kinase CheA
VRLEQKPDNGQVLGSIFRVVHTIKGTCGFPRFAATGSADSRGRTLIGKFRNGMPVTGGAVTLILPTIDRIKTILDGLEELKLEPPGDDADLISQLAEMAGAVQMQLVQLRSQEPTSCGRSAMQTEAEPVEVKAAGATDVRPASHALRVSIDTLDQLMTMVSELVLTRSQLFEVLRRHEDRTIEVVEGRFLMQYGGELMPLFGVDPQSGPRTKSAQPGRCLPHTVRARVPAQQTPKYPRPRLVAISGGG